jgi:hypothetical protein
MMSGDLPSLRLASPQLEGRRHTDWYTKYLKQRGCLTQNPAAYNLGMKERFVRELRARYSKTEDTEGRRIDRQTIGDRYVEDGILYRVR